MAKSQRLRVERLPRLDPSLEGYSRRFWGKETPMTKILKAGEKLSGEFFGTKKSPRISLRPTRKIKINF